MVDSIAIIGVGCRLPGGCDGLSDFWSMVLEGGLAIGSCPSGRRKNGTTQTGGYLDRVDGFDCAAFGISPREAAEMDPQQRLLLEVTWEAMESAQKGPLNSRGGEVAVFIGAMWGDYERVACPSREAVCMHTATGLNASILANRISYCFGWCGPSLTVNTASSSSLVAVHLACQALLTGEAAMAVAGGVNLILSEMTTASLEAFGGISSSGTARPFDARADGYVRGEGAGVVVLKPLAQAQADGDPIYAIIRGSAVNNDGVGEGLTVPSVQAQSAVIREAHRRAGVDADQIGYVEAHGSGTMVGDPIEARALGEVFAARRNTMPLAIGTVKGSIGHLEAAAGIAGLLRAIGVVRYGVLPPTVGFVRPHPSIDFEALGLHVVVERASWPESQSRRLAGVSSFGFGGTNCHLVLEARDLDEARVSEGPASNSLVVLSAACERGLRASAWGLRRRILEGVPEGLEAFAQASRTTRSHLSCRAAIVAASLGDVADLLEGVAQGRVSAREVLCGPGVSGSDRSVEDGRRYLKGTDGSERGARHGATPRRLLPTLPAYPFQRRRVWTRSDTEHPFGLHLEAADETALSSLARRWSERLKGKAEREVREACMHRAGATQRGSHRLALVASSRTEIFDALERAARGETQAADRRGQARPPSRIAFVFPGHGCQWLGMARELLQRSTRFADALDRCDAALSRHLDWSLIDELHAAPRRSRLHEAEVLQPSVFAVEVALCALWEEVGLVPDLVIGHSMGEVAAAVIAGALELEEGARVIAARGRSLKPVEGQGGLLWVAMPAIRMEDWLSKAGLRAAIAAINAPESTVISANLETLASARARLESQKVPCRPVPIGFASHSADMDAIVPEFVRSLNGLRVVDGRVPMLSTVDVTSLAGATLGPEYWGRNLRQPVRFMAAIEQAVDLGYTCFVEPSPHTVLLPAIAEVVGGRGGQATLIGTGRRGACEVQGFAEQVGRAFVAGLPVRAFNPSPYAEANTVRHDPDDGAVEGNDAEQERPWLGALWSTSHDPKRWVWQGRVAFGALGFCASEVGRQRVTPAALIEMAWHAAHEVLGETLVGLSRVRFPEPAEVVAAEVFVEVSVRVSSVAAEVHLAARDEHGDWETWLTAFATVGKPVELDVEPLPLVRRRCHGERALVDLYGETQHGGRSFARGLHGLIAVHGGVSEVLAHWKCPQSATGHRVLGAVEACLQVAAWVGPPEAGSRYPVAIETLRTIRACSGEPGIAHAVSEETSRARATFRDSRGTACVHLDGIEYENADRTTSAEPSARWFASTWHLDLRDARPVDTDPPVVLVTAVGQDAALGDLSLWSSLAVIPMAESADGLVSLQNAIQDLSASGPVSVVVVFESASPSTPWAWARRLEAMVELVAAPDVRAVSQFIVATVGAQCLGEDKSSSPELAVLWGAMRHLGHRYPALVWSCVDLERSVSVDPPTLRRLLGVPARTQVAFRGNDPFVFRVHETAIPPTNAHFVRAELQPFEVRKTDGVLELVASEAVEGGPGAVAVEIDAADGVRPTGRSARQVGRVVELGPDARSVARGDRVIVLDDVPLASRRWVSEDALLRWGTEDDPVEVFSWLERLTAHALFDELESGSTGAPTRVLVVGLVLHRIAAFVDAALARGAATWVGTSSDVDATGLGVPLLGLHGRSLLSEALSAVPDGFDVVVSIHGDLSLEVAESLVRDGGVVAQILGHDGDAWGPLRSDFGTFRVIRFDVAQWIRSHPSKASRSLDALRDERAQKGGRLQSTRARSISLETWLQKPSTRGTCVTLAGAGALPVRMAGDEGPPVHAAGRYLVVGGARSAVDLYAQWLMDAGAGTIELDDLEERRTVHAVPCSARGDLSEMEPLPLRGILAVAVSGDEAVTARLAERLLRFQDHALDFFVICSASLGAWGLPGPVVRAGAHEFMGALVQRRCAQGLRASLVEACVEPFVREFERRRGLTPTPWRTHLSDLAVVMRSDAPRVAPIAFDAGTWLDAYPATASDDMLRPLFRDPSAREVDERRGRSGASVPCDEHSVRRRIVEEVAHVLQLSGAQIDENTPLSQLGMNSLMGVELRTRLAVVFERTLSPTLLWNCPTIRSLSAFFREPVSTAVEAAATDLEVKTSLGREDPQRTQALAMALAEELRPS